MTEERKEEQIAPEVAAAWKKLKYHAEALLRIMNDPELDGIAKYEAELVRDWDAIVLSDDVPQAFWLQALEDVGYWLQRIKEGIEERNIEYALRCAKPLQRCLGHYAKLLGLEIPPEEEEAPGAPSTAEEVRVEVKPVTEPKPVEGTPLAVLGLSTRAYNRLARSKALAEVVGIAEGDLRIPYAEEVARVFAHGAKGTTGEEFLLNIPLFGPKALAELKEKLKKHHFIVEPWEE